MTFRSMEMPSQPADLSASCRVDPAQHHLPTDLEPSIGIPHSGQTPEAFPVRSYVHFLHWFARNGGRMCLYTRTPTAVETTHGSTNTSDKKMIPSHTVSEPPESLDARAPNSNCAKSSAMMNAENPPMAARNDETR